MQRALCERCILAERDENRKDFRLFWTRAMHGCEAGLTLSILPPAGTNAPRSREHA
jgi:hypothetical protein